MPDVPLKFLIMVGVALALVWGGYELRNVAADRDMARLQVELDEQTQKAEDAAEALRRKRNEVTTTSSQRIDAEAPKQQAITQTVTKEVIKYVQNPAHGKCAMPDDWVCTYNKSLGLPCSSGLPSAGPAPVGPSAAVPSSDAGARHSLVARSIDE